MATTPSLVYPPMTSSDATSVVALGSQSQDAKGNQYIYLKGVASTATGDFVVYDAVFATTRAVAASRGPGGFAMAATGANQFGWYQIGGNNPSVTAAGAIAANAVVAVSATPGAIGATAAGQKIENVFTTAAASGGRVAVSITAPPYAGGLG